MEKNTFGQIINNSTELVKKNYNDIFRMSLYMSIIMAILSFLFVSIFNVKIDNVTSFKPIAKFLSYLFLFEIIMFLSNLFITILFYRYFYIKKKKLNVDLNKVFYETLSKYLSVLLFSVAFIIIMILLFFLFIIPSIIFGIFWIFWLVIFINENKNFIDSLKISFNLVKDNWWRTFFYFLGVGIGIGLISGIINKILELVLSNGTSIGSQIFNTFIYFIQLFILYILIAYMISFIVNYYYALKEEKNKE